MPSLITVTGIQRVLQCLLSEQGFTDQPVGGCPVSKIAPVDRVEIDAIVQNVLAELKRRGLA